MNVVETVAQPRPALVTVAWTTIAVGAVILLVQLTREPTSAYAAMLTAALFSLSICLGGGIFIATQSAANAVWWYPIRRVPLLLVQALPIPGVLLGFVLLFGLSALYPWSNPDLVHESTLLQQKAGWLNAPFFFARAIAVFLIWFGFMSAFRARVGPPGIEGSPQPGLRRLSILFLVLLAPTLSIASWDWAMSLEPEWFSTMVGVYFFSGSFLAGIAGVVVLASLLERTSVSPARLNDSLRHDLGKLLFAFSCFWAYIWFCEYMLIWYSNVPEEATHFVARQTAGWTVLFWLNPILNFVVPFVVLMPITNKRNPDALFQVAAVVLLGRWLDMFLWVWPSVGPFPGFPVVALVAALVAMSGMALIWRRGLLSS